MGRAQKIALLVIWLGILGSIGAVLFSWQVRREWLEPGGYMLVRRNLLTSEQDVWTGDRWVPLQGFRTKSGPMLAERPSQQAGERPGSAPDRPALPMRAPAPSALESPDQSPQQAEVPPAPPIRPRAPVRVRMAPDPGPSEAAAPPVAGEDDDSSSAPRINPDLPIVRAPSPDDAPAAEALPSPAPDQVASNDDHSAVSAPDQAQQATAPPACDPTAPGAAC